MANRDGGVRVHEQKRHRFADDVAASEDDCVRAFDLNIVAAQNLHAARGRASDEARAAADQTAEAYGLKRVHILSRIYRSGSALVVTLGRSGRRDRMSS